MSTNLAVYIKQPEQLTRFREVLGHSANGYVQSVIIAAGMNDELAQCTDQSIVKAALRAATLGLSCDPAQREAHMVPRNRKIKGRNGQGDTWIKEASFELHYLGLYKLAIRTGKYWTINVIPVLKNQEVKMGRDGMHYVFEGDMKIDHFPVDRVTARNLSNVKGWLGYFKTTKGFEKTSYMTVEEIMEHAGKYSKSYQKDLENNKRQSKWSDPDILPIMQMKTVLRDLLKWADTSGDAGAALQEALAAEEATEEAVDAEVDELEKEFPQGSEFTEDPKPDEPEQEPLTTDEAVGILMGEAPKPKDNELTDALSVSAVKWAAMQWNISTAEAKAAIQKAINDGKIKQSLPKAEFKKFATGL